MSVTKYAQQTLQGQVLQEDRTKHEEKQEYVYINYDIPHDHLPVLFRVLTRNGKSVGDIIGRAFMPPYHSDYPYAYVYLDRTYNNKKMAKDTGLVDMKLSKWVGRQLWDTYIHETLHLYFSTRFDEEDTYDYRYNEDTGKMVRQDYEFTYARKWGSNERIIDGIATALTSIFFGEEEYIEHAIEWNMCFKDLDLDV